MREDWRYGSKSVEAPQLPNIFTVYPNPTTGLVTVIIDRDDINDEIIEFLEHYGMQDIEDCENVTVSILDSNGRMLQTQEFNYEEDGIDRGNTSKYKNILY